MKNATITPYTLSALAIIGLMAMVCLLPDDSAIVRTGANSYVLGILALVLMSLGVTIGSKIGYREYLDEQK